MWVVFIFVNVCLTYRCLFLVNLKRHAFNTSIISYCLIVIYFQNANIVHVNILWYLAVLLSTISIIRDICLMKVKNLEIKFKLNDWDIYFLIYLLLYENMVDFIMVCIYNFFLYFNVNKFNVNKNYLREFHDIVIFVFQLLKNVMRPASEYVLKTYLYKSENTQYNPFIFVSYV